jgi:hypothetical protein
VAVEELLTRPGLVLLVRGGDAGRRAELRAALEGMGTVVGVARSASAAADPADGDWVVDADDLLGRAYGFGSEGIALIRPDGYLGLVTDSADPDPVRRYLAEVLGVAGPRSAAVGSA